MKMKKLCPEDIIKLSTSISLLLIEKFDMDEINTIKNILCSVNANLSAYCTQYYINKKN